MKMHTAVERNHGRSFPACLNKESAVLEVLFPSFKVRKKILIAFRLAPVRLLRPQ